MPPCPTWPPPTNCLKASSALLVDNLSDAARPAIDSWDKVDASKGWARAAGGEERNKQLVQNIEEMERFIETVSFAYTLVQQYGEDLKYR